MSLRFRGLHMNEKIINLKRITSALRSYGVLLFMVLVVIVTAVVEPNFFTLDNLLNILRQVSVIGIVACGMTFVIIGGAFDLSVGAVVSLGGVVAITTVNSTGNVILAILLAMLVGTVVGIINGTLISIINGGMGEAFIVTYGTQTVVAALALFVSKGLFIAGRLPAGIYKEIGRGVWPIVVFIIIAGVMQFILRKTMFGRKLCFIGGNIKAAKMSGIRVKLNRTVYFAVSGMLAGIAAVVLTSRVTSANPMGGDGFEMDAIAAVVVGGTSLLGGSGSIGKTVMGTIVIGIMTNALNLMGITSYPQIMLKGVIILLAVGLDVWNKQIKKRDMANEKSYN